MNGKFAAGKQLTNEQRNTTLLNNGYGVPVIKNDKSAVNFWAYKILSIIGKRLE